MPRGVRGSGNGRRRRRNANGNFSLIEVRVGRLPGAIQTVALNGGRKVSDALDGAELDIGDVEGYEIRVNGEVADLDANLSSNDTVLFVRRIRGN